MATRQSSTVAGTPATPCAVESEGVHVDVQHIFSMVVCVYLRRLRRRRRVFVEETRPFWGRCGRVIALPALAISLDVFDITRVRSFVCELLWRGVLCCRAS
jgi:hypothetical protein